MSMDPVHHTHEIVTHEVEVVPEVPAYDREVIVRDDGAAVSSVMLTMIGIIVAVALIAVVVAVAPWGGGSNGRSTNITPGQGGSDNTAPAPSQNAPSQNAPTRPQNQSQPQIVPTTNSSPR